MNRMRWILGMAAGCAVLAGCAKKGPPATQPATLPTAVSTRSELEQKIQQLRQRSEALADHAEQLAGRTDQDHRMLVGQSLAGLAQVLPILAGSRADGSLDQRIGIIESSRDKLRHEGDEPLAEPTINTALRSASGSLERITEDRFADQPQVLEALRQIKEKIGELDTTHGAIHRLVVARCLELMSQAVSEMSQTTIDRWQDQIQLIQPAGDSAGE